MISEIVSLSKAFVSVTLGEMTSTQAGSLGFVSLWLLLAWTVYMIGGRLLWSSQCVTLPVLWVTEVNLQWTRVPSNCQHCVAAEKPLANILDLMSSFLVPIGQKP